MENEKTLDWLIDLVENAKSINTEEAKRNSVALVSTSLVESLMHNAASVESSKLLKLLGPGIPATPRAPTVVVSF